ncbi:MAG: siroheme synthase CysG [Acidobacteriota bacterium]
MLPVMLSVRGRSCLVVGGGGVALRKAESLLAEGALVTVVSPAPCPQVEALAGDGRIRLERRPYEAGEAAAYMLVFAATDDRAVNRQVFEDGQAARVWVNVADDPELCSFHVPARVRRGSLQIAVASSGEAPFATRRLRQALERRFGPEWGEWLRGAARVRDAVRGAGLPPAVQEKVFDRFFEATVDQQKLSARVPTEEEIAAWTGLDAPLVANDAPAETGEPPTTASGRDGRARVSLVGAGPGDPGLLTLRGRACLRLADAVVYDRLAAAALPSDLDGDVELHAVGKEAGNHPVPQDEINALLVRLARQGKRVVRLKGGDPFVFGRGGEEAEALAAAGIPFEVVPGVTAGVAAPAYAGIPVTHRRESVRVTLLTAHESAKEDGQQVRWDLLAADPHATLVGYMGVTSLPNVVRRLLAAGMNPSMPGAVIEQGTTSAQRVVRAPLADLAEAAAGAGINPPALFVIGPTSRHGATLDWRSGLALAGQRVVIAAPAGALGEALEASGAALVEVPLPVKPAARIVLGALPVTSCVVRSPVEVDALDGERDRPGWGRGVAAICLGAQTAARARAVGWPGVVELAENTDPVEVVSRLRGSAHAAPR